MSSFQVSSPSANDALPSYDERVYILQGKCSILGSFLQDLSTNNGQFLKNIIINNEIKNICSDLYLISHSIKPYRIKLVGSSNNSTFLNNLSGSRSTPPEELSTIQPLRTSKIEYSYSDHQDRFNVKIVFRSKEDIEDDIRELLKLLLTAQRNGEPINKDDPHVQNLVQCLCPLFDNITMDILDGLLDMEDFQLTSMREEWRQRIGQSLDCTCSTFMEAREWIDMQVNTCAPQLIKQINVHGPFNNLLPSIVVTEGANQVVQQTADEYWVVVDSPRFIEQSQDQLRQICESKQTIRWITKNDEWLEPLRSTAIFFSSYFPSSSDVCHPEEISSCQQWMHDIYTNQLSDLSSKESLFHACIEKLKQLETIGKSSQSLQLRDQVPEWATDLTIAVKKFRNAIKENIAFDFDRIVSNGRWHEHQNSVKALLRKNGKPYSGSGIIFPDMTRVILQEWRHCQESVILGHLNILTKHVMDGKHAGVTDLILLQLEKALGNLRRSLINSDDIYDDLFSFIVNEGYFRRHGDGSSAWTYNHPTLSRKKINYFTPDEITIFYQRVANFIERKLKKFENILNEQIERPCSAISDGCSSSSEVESENVNTRLDAFLDSLPQVEEYLLQHRRLRNCPACHQELTAPYGVLVPCGHIYHEACARQIAVSRGVCVICRTRCTGCCEATGIAATAFLHWRNSNSSSDFSLDIPGFINWVQLRNEVQENMTTPSTIQEETDEESTENESAHRRRNQ